MNDVTGRILFSLLTNELSGTLMFCVQIICWENQILMSILEMLCDPVVHVVGSFAVISSICGLKQKACFQTVHCLVN